MTVDVNVNVWNLLLLEGGGGETCGFLLGSVARTDPLCICIEDYVAIPAERSHRRAYVLARDERAEFQESLLQAWAKDRPAAMRPLGYFRTNVRGKLRLSAEDVELCDEFFPDAADIAMLIKPYAGIDMAMIFVRKNGEFPSVGVPVEVRFRAHVTAP